MAFIGDADIFIGSEEWFIGSWQFSPAGAPLSRVGSAIVESPWIFRDNNNRVLTSLDLTPVAQNTTLTTDINLEYRGIRPVIILGFYITEISSAIYSGNKNGQIDKYELLRWADEYTIAGAESPGLPGLEISQKHWESSEWITTQVKSGTGDSRATPLSYIGHPGAILPLDQRAYLKLHITIPNAALKQITEASRFHFGFEISSIEIPESIERGLGLDGVL